MSKYDISADEKAVAAANGLGAGGILEPAESVTTSHDREDYEDHESSSSRGNDDRDAREDKQQHDVELARTVSSGPPYTVFTTGKKRFIVIMAMVGGFFSPFSANIYFPALNLIASDLHVSNALVNLTLTTYMIFQGLAPTFMGDLADTAGRRPAFIIGFIIYIGACIGCAESKSFAALLVLRCLQSSGSSGVVALASGIVADISTTAERGKYMGLVTSGLMIGPAVGPILGGIFAQFLGWRWIFWFLTIVSCLSAPEKLRLTSSVGRSLPRAVDCCFSRDWSKRRRQWFYTTTTMEHVCPELSGRSESTRTRQ